ncbi:MAG: RNase adapter RapZ [Eubacterium sp.]|jgi:UPF0042 nucleotide-binding protein
MSASEIKEIKNETGTPMEVVILTGLSGAGKTNAGDWFEDKGYYCVDNMPPALIMDFINLSLQSKRPIKKAAFVADVRGGEFFDDLKECIISLKNNPKIDCTVVFIEASERSLIRRFNETRRAHPLANGGPITRDVIAKEANRLREIRDMSDFIIDTTGLKVSEFKGEMEKILGGEGSNFAINIISFGYKFGIPPEADLVIDVRFIPNPYYVASLRKLTGRNKKVSSYVMKQPISGKFIESFKSMLDLIIPGYIKEGKYHLNIAFGCTGGQHRSVAIACEMAEQLRNAGYRVTLEHRDN